MIYMGTLIMTPSSFVEEGITAPIFRELSIDDLNELKKKLTFGGRIQIGKLHKEVKK